MIARPQIVAHRGASHDAPENTLAALRLGFAQGADAGECDVRLTSDGHAVLLHDASAHRTTGVDLVAANTPLETLRDLGLPSLEEALVVVPAGRRLFIEIKCGVEILPAIERAFAASLHPADAFVLMSFDRAVTVEAKRRFPAVEVHQLSEWDADLTAALLVDEARAAGLDGLNLDKDFPIDAAFAAAVRAAGLKLCVWTVDDAALGRRIAAAGVDAVTTNRPGWLREQLASSHSTP